MIVSTKPTSPENLELEKRYRYVVAGETWYGIFKGLACDHYLKDGKVVRRLVIVVQQYGVTKRVKWCEVQGMEAVQ